MLEERYKEKLLRALDYHFPGARIYLFGSRATGSAKPTADIDIAVDMGEEIDYLEIDRAWRTIDGLNIPYKVDLVDLQSVPEKMKQDILSEGILWKLEIECVCAH